MLYFAFAFSYIVLNAISIPDINKMICFSTKKCYHYYDMGSSHSNRKLKTNPIT